MSKLQLFRESYNIPINTKDIEILKETKLVESSNGSQLKAFVILKNQPYGGYTEGLNGRTYSRSLWEKLINANLLEGLPAVDSHMDNPLPAENTIGLWKNHRLSENHPVADFYVTHERLARNLALGVRTIGISTSMFGEIKEGTRGIVNEDTVTPVSIDVVFNPSMEVYLSNERIGESKESAITESNVTNTNKTILQSSGGHIPMDKFTEAQENRKITAAITGAKKVLEKNETIKFQETIEGLDFYISVIKESGIFSEKLKEMTEVRNGISDKLNEDVQGKLKTLDESSDKIKELTSIVESQNQKLLMAEKMIEDVKKNTEIKEEEGSCKESASKLKDLLEAHKNLISDFNNTAKLAFSLKEQLDLVKSNYKTMQRDFLGSTKMNLYATKKIEFLESKANKVKEEGDDTIYDVTATAEELPGTISGTGEQSLAIQRIKQAIKDQSMAESASKKKELQKESESVRVKKFVESQISKSPILSHIKSELLEKKSVEEALDSIEKFKEAAKDSGPVKLQEASDFDFDSLMRSSSSSKTF